MKNFNCQSMPEDVKNLFFDTYRLNNNSRVIIHVGSERHLIKNWLIENGADTDDEVGLDYEFTNEKTKMFSYKDFRADEDEDF